MGRSTVHYADNETNNILKRLHNKLRPAGTPVERVEYIIELLLLRIFETKLKQDEVFKPLRKIFSGESYRLLFSYIHSLSNGDRILAELNKNIFPFYATILQEARKVIKGNLPPKIQDQLVLMEEVFANSNFTNNVKGGVITEVIGLVNDIDERYILKTDLLGDAIESALSETGGTKDLGLYRTPDHIRRMMVEMIAPDFTDIIFDPACGTAGFLFDTYDYVINKANETGIYPSTDVANMFYRTGIGGIEYQGRIRKMAAVNMYIRGLNPHNIMQGDSLKMYDPARDAGSKTMVIANPPFGAERDQPAYPNVWEEYSKESETTILFVKLMFDYLKAGGRCAVVVSEGFLTWGQGSACALRKMLLNEANLRAIISLPQGVFVSKSGQGAKTSILYFEKGKPTDFVWYYKIENDGFSMGTNRKPIEGSQILELLTHFAEVKQGKKPEDTPRSFCIDCEQIEMLDPQKKERIINEIRNKATERNALKREKTITELERKFAAKKISKTVYTEELSQFDNNLEAQVENEIAKAIEKAHTYHFNLQNYRANDDDKQMVFPLVELKEILQQYENKTVIDDEKEYKQVTVSNSGEVKLREIKFGAEIGTKKQNFVNFQNDKLLIYSRLGLHTGAIGLIPKELNNSIVTVDMPVFKPQRPDVNLTFVALLCQTKRFIEKVIEQNPTGAAQTRFHEDKFLQLQIPLPPLEIQNEIVEKIEKQKQIIEGAEKIINEWQPSIDESAVKRPLKDFIIDTLYGISSPLNEEGKYPVLRMNNLDIQGNWYLDDLKYIDDSIKEERKLEIGDFLFNRTNSKELVGKSGVINFEFDGTWAGYLIRLRFNDELSPHYLSYLLAQKKYRNYFSGIGKQAGGQANINADELAKTLIDWYPLEIQLQIVEKIDQQIVALESAYFLKTEAENRIKEILTGIWKGKQSRATNKIIQNDIPEEKSFLKRKVLATYIINQSLNDPNFGNVKFEKLFYISENIAIRRNFGQKYYIQAAGPYDNVFTREYFRQVEQSKWFKRQKEYGQYIFIAGENHNKSLNTYNFFSTTELERVNTFINYFKKSDYEQPEIIATLYAVWNNRIIRQEPITDDLLKEDFLNWDTQKVKYKDRLDNALAWMRKEGIVPDGWGKVIEKVEKKKTIKK